MVDVISNCDRANSDTVSELNNLRQELDHHDLYQNKLTEVLGSLKSLEGTDNPIGLKRLYKASNILEKADI